MAAFFTVVFDIPEKKRLSPEDRTFVLTLSADDSTIEPFSEDAYKLKEAFAFLQERESGEVLRPFLSAGAFTFYASTGKTTLTLPFEFVVGMIIKDVLGAIMKRTVVAGMN